MQLCTVGMVDLVHVRIGRKANHCYEILLMECWSVNLNYKQLNTMIFIKVEYVSSLQDSLSDDAYTPHSV